MVTPVAHGDHHVGPCEHPVDHLAHRLRRIGHVDVRIDGIRGPGTGDAGPDGSALAAVRNIDDLDIRNGLPQRPVLFLAETMRRTVVDDDQVQALVRIPGAKLRIGAGQRRDEPRSRIAIAVLATCLLLLLLRLSSLNAEYKLKHQELLHQALKAQKEQTDQLFYGMTCIVDRYTVVDLLKDRYEYHEYSSNNLYPETGSYQNLLDTVARNYIVLSDTENIKISHLLNKEYLQKVLHKGNGIMKIEYSKRTENVYKIMNVVAVEWDEAGIPQKVMMIAQDIGKRHELENLANTDGLTGLFNERYFSSVLHRKEQKKLPFVLYYLDLDHFKPVNDTYGHDMGDKLLKAVAERLLKCIRSNDFAFRIGGDEFALIISAEMEDSLCMQTKMRIVQSLLLPYEIDGKTLHIGASCGYAVYPLETEDTGKIRILADQRMYAEKKENHRKAAESQSKDPSQND